MTCILILLFTKLNGKNVPLNNGFSILVEINVVHEDFGGCIGFQIIWFWGISFSLC